MDPSERSRATTRIVLAKSSGSAGLDAFTRLRPDERKRLMVRVLCELVAYEPDDGTSTARDPIERLAG